MTLALRLSAATLAIGLAGAATQAQAHGCHRHHARYAPARYVATRYVYAPPVRRVTAVRYVTRRVVVREPVYMRRYYEPAYYRTGYWAPYGYDDGYGYGVYGAYGPRVVVSYGSAPYWRHHRRWSSEWAWHDNGRHRGWDHHGWR